MKRIVKFANFTEFSGEIRPDFECDDRVRVSSHHITTSGVSIPRMELCIDIQGINAHDELCWLHYGVEIQLTPGTLEPWTEHGKAIYDSWPILHNLIIQTLEDLDYPVYPGMYAVPNNTPPLNGNLEIVQWNKELKLWESNDLSIGRLWADYTKDCLHRDRDDGTCGHPQAHSPECHAWACPFKVRYGEVKG